MPRSWPIAALLFWLLAGTATAGCLPDPEGEVILVVEGDIGCANGEETARFDREMLRAVGAETITTATIWTDGRQSFTGVPIARLLAAVQARGDTLVAQAINDYAMRVPVGELVADGAILAFERNGRPMTVRDKGPLWIVYPWDDDPDLRTEAIYARSIWQLARIRIDG